MKTGSNLALAGSKSENPAKLPPADACQVEPG